VYFVDINHRDAVASHKQHHIIVAVIQGRHEVAGDIVAHAHVAMTDRRPEDERQTRVWHELNLDHLSPAHHEEEPPEQDQATMEQRYCPGSVTEIFVFLPDMTDLELRRGQKDLSNRLHWLD
jgi:hypothetical protein